MYHLLRFVRSRCERLLTQNMFLRLKRLEGPLVMKLIWKRNVDRFHFRVCERLFVAAVRLSEAEFLLKRHGLFQASSGDRIQITVVRLQHTGNCLPLRDSGCSKHSPLYLLHSTSSQNAALSVDFCPSLSCLRSHHTMPPQYLWLSGRHSPPPSDSPDRRFHILRRRPF